MYIPNKETLRVCVVFASSWIDNFRLSRVRPMARLEGSDLLRFQMKDLISPHLPDYIELCFSSFSPNAPVFGFDAWLRAQPPSVFILLKNVGYFLTPEQIDRLRERAIAVGLDHKDGRLSRVQLSLFDFHISSSLTGLTALNKIIAETRSSLTGDVFADVLFQSHDTRLNALRFRDGERFSPVYLGRMKHVKIPERILSEIAVHEVTNGRDMTRALEHLPNYNFHYAVRPTARPELHRAYKPFTKGVTAAACRSNILVDRDVDDAVEFLTPDYPYIAASNAARDVEDVYRKARDEFGGPEWKRGLEIMRGVRERLSGKALAEQFVRIVTRAADGRRSAA